MKYKVGDWVMLNAFAQNESANFSDIGIHGTGPFLVTAVDDRGGYRLASQDGAALYQPYYDVELESANFLRAVSEE